MGLLVPTSYEIPPLGGTPAAPVGQPTLIAAGGGSIVNTGTVTLIFATTSNPNPPNQISIAPGGTLPWPSNQPCWCWASPGSNITGQCSVVPLPLSFSPGPGATESILYTGQASDIAVTVTLTQANVGYLKIVGPDGLSIPTTRGAQSSLLYVAYETAGHLVGGEQIWIIPIDPVVDQDYIISWALTAAEPYDILAVYGTAFTLVYDTALATLLVENGSYPPSGGAQGLPISGYDKNSNTYQNIEVDSNGGLIIAAATKSVSLNALGTAIPAPSSGAWYVFGWQISGTSTAADQVAIGDSIAGLFDTITFNDVATYVNYSSPPLGPFRCTGAVSVNTVAGSGFEVLSLIIRYAPGP